MYVCVRVYDYLFLVRIIYFLETIHIKKNDKTFKFNKKFFELNLTGKIAERPALLGEIRPLTGIF